MFMIPAHLFHAIAPCWREDLVRFIDTGEASDGFFVFLDSNDECQRVVEICLALVTQDLVSLAKAAKEEPYTHETRHVLASSLATQINLLLTMSADEQRRVLSQLGPQVKAGLHNVLHESDAEHGRSTMLTM